MSSAGMVAFTHSHCGLTQGGRNAAADVAVAVGYAAVTAAGGNSGRGVINDPLKMAIHTLSLQGNGLPAIAT